MKTLQLSLEENVAAEVERVAAAFSKKPEAFAADLIRNAVSASTESLLEVIRMATKAFGDMDTAYHWMLTPNFTLGDKVPVELLGDESGRQAVKTVLGRLEHGVYS